MNKKIDITSPSERANNTAIGKSIIRKGKSAIKKDMASKMIKRDTGNIKCHRCSSKFSGYEGKEDTCPSCLKQIMK